MLQRHPVPVLASRPETEISRMVAGVISKTSSKPPFWVWSMWDGNEKAGLDFQQQSRE